MLNKPSGIIQIQIVMSPERVMFGLADDGRVYIWDTPKKIWIAVTHNQFDLRES